MATHPFRERVYGHVGAVVETAAQVGRVERGVDHERDVVSLTDCGDGLEVENVETGIADQFTVDQFCIVLDRITAGIDVGWVEKRRRNAEAGQRILHQADVAAVHLRGGYDMVALAENGSDGAERRGHARRCAHGSRAALEGRNTLLEHADCRVGDARVGMPAALEIEDR